MSKPDRYWSLYEEASRDLETGDLVEILSEREMSLKDIWRLVEIVALSLEYDHLNDQDT